MELKAVVLNPKDNVATALTAFNKGDEVGLNSAGQKLKITLVASIPFGHKFSIRPIGKGKPVIKYGEVIGITTTAVVIGDHVHVHNVASTRGH